MKKKNWIYALIVTLIIIIAIVSMIFFVQTKYGDRIGEKGSQSVSNKNNKIHIAIVNEDQPTTYNGKKVELGRSIY